MKEVNRLGLLESKKQNSAHVVLSVLERSDSPLSAIGICKQTENEDCTVWLFNCISNTGTLRKRKCGIKKPLLQTAKCLFMN